MLRALVGAATGYFILSMIFPVLSPLKLIRQQPELLTIEFYIYFFGFLLFAIIFCALFLIVEFYLLRRVMAGSPRTIRFLIVMIFISLVFDLAHLSLSIIQSNFSSTSYWSSPYFTILLILSTLLAMSVRFLILHGLFGIVKIKNLTCRQLLIDNKYSRKLWPGWSAFRRSFLLIMGIPVPPQSTKMSKRVTLAAIGAFAWDGWLFTWYLEQSNKFDQIYGQYKGQPMEPVAFCMMIAIFITAPFWFWGGFALSRRLRRYARRRSLLSADATMSADPRKPVLFLRSFSDDQISLSRAKMPWLLRFFDPGAVAGTLEELLVWEYADVGPVLAVGKPSDNLPPLGAARKYCKGIEWQEIVCSIMQASELIVIGVGRSAGLAWEVETVKAENLLDKCVFMFPPDFARDRSMLCDLFTQLDLRGRMPEVGSEQVVLCVSFLSRNQPLLLLSSRLTEIEYQIALRATKQPDIISPERNLDLEAHSPAALDQTDLTTEMGTRSPE
jgi:hypothetical protein